MVKKQVHAFEEQHRTGVDAKRDESKVHPSCQSARGFTDGWLYLPGSSLSQRRPLQQKPLFPMLDVIVENQLTAKRTHGKPAHNRTNVKGFYRHNFTSTTQKNKHYDNKPTIRY